MNKTTAINTIKNLDTTYLNQDQKRLALKIIESFDEKDDLNALLSFILKRIKIGFTFDETFEVAEGHIAVVNQLKDKNINIKNNNLATENENKLIIGENYEALKNLLLTHKEKIDIIYIDPPYNTEKAANDGNNLSSKEGQASKFIYKDKFGRNGWLNMMNERLKLAKELLSEDGVIFVSIDDNEQAYLKVLMDEIFGEENFINLITWVSNRKGRQTSNVGLAKTNEYILFYAKNISTQNKIEMNREFLEKLMSNLYDSKDIQIFNDDISDYILLNELQNTNINSFNIHTRKNLYYPIYTNGNDISLEKEDNKYFEILPPKNKDGLQGVWRWSKEKVLNEKHNLKVINKNGLYKIYTKKRNISYYVKDIIFSSKISTNSGNSLLQTILKSDFLYPKPTSLIKFLTQFCSNKNATVLDFFAGSGTTGHAVLEINREDGGSRNFILVTNNENNIGIDVTYERLYRIINGQGTNKENFDWLKNNQPYSTAKLRVFDIKHFDISIGKTTEKSIDEIKEIAISNLKLLNPNYNPQNLDIYYDLSGLNPYKKEEK
ncbi:site-specific DNA-methyltransferase [Candidatus Mycoplasma pogonae]